jgi:hypothetical protein
MHIKRVVAQRTDVDATVLNRGLDVLSNTKENTNEHHKSSRTKKKDTYQCRRFRPAPQLWCAL